MKCKKAVRQGLLKNSPWTIIIESQISIFDIMRDKTVNRGGYFGKRTIPESDGTDVLYPSCPVGTTVRCGYFAEGGGDIEGADGDRTGDPLYPFGEV